MLPATRGSLSASRDAVSQLVGVQDGPPAGRAPHPGVTQPGAGGLVHVGVRLVVAQRQAGRDPLIKTQCRTALSVGQGMEQSLVNSHVSRAVGGWGDEQSPSCRCVICHREVVSIILLFFLS